MHILMVIHVTHPNERKNVTVNTRHTIDIAKPTYVTIDNARASSDGIAYMYVIVTS